MKTNAKQLAKYLFFKKVVLDKFFCDKPEATRTKTNSRRKTICTLCF